MAEGKEKDPIHQKAGSCFYQDPPSVETLEWYLGCRVSKLPARFFAALDHIQAGMNLGTVFGPVMSDQSGARATAEAMQAIREFVLEEDKKKIEG